MNCLLFNYLTSCAVSLPPSACNALQSVDSLIKGIQIQGNSCWETLVLIRLALFSTLPKCVCVCVTLSISKLGQWNRNIWLVKILQTHTEPCEHFS